jgi:predicted phosphodiesterase
MERAGFATGSQRVRVVPPGPRLAALGDVHGNLPGLSLVISDARRRGADAILCTGDVVGYGPWPAACIALLREAGIPVARGNYDTGVGMALDDCGCAYRTEAERASGAAGLRWTQERVSAADRRWLAALPGVVEVGGPSGEILVEVFHGSLRMTNEYLYGDRPEAGLARSLAGARTELLVCGHTHLPYIRRLAGETTLVNCGTCGRPKGGRPVLSYAMIDLSPAWRARPSGDKRPYASIELVELAYDASRVAGAVLASGLPGAFADLILTGGAK